ncbi:MAG: hypothetical protein KGJ74_03055 [Betaproteobacteria bacterium]|jgi:PBP1b-binding outer membrane lipoprotein LpoB|nr:hypothetical protein [Betaproteobacteria bacterium]
MNAKIISLLFSVVFLSSCAALTPPPYSISADTDVALKKMSVGNIDVGEFKAPENFSAMCRAVGPIAPPDNMTFQGYIRKALADELKVAGKFDDHAPKVTLSGSVEQLKFSSSTDLVRGAWDIGLRVNSSNGKSDFVSEHYEFESGFLGGPACQNTAAAYFPAVRALIGKLVESPQFVALATP